ncbi:MAG: SGNH/GDSL hydrolase family protein [Kiritimatiellae bacterium]|nr:SGNH/GDSL hydrolase family protein [Kiritimatiellia bacterium]
MRWLFLLAVGFSVASASGVQWIDGKELPMEGKAFEDVEEFYDRLPASATTTNTSSGLQSLKHHTAGMVFRFKTTSPTLAFRWSPYYDVCGPRKLPGCRYNGMLGMAHMPATGVSGIDVYVKGSDGEWKHRQTGFIYGSANRNATSWGRISRFGISPGTPVMVYMPLYNGIRKFEVELADGARIEPLPPRRSGINKPVVFYGTSITQGGCASRPGMAFSNIVGRKLDVPTVNLGFTGNGHMEPAMADYLSRIDASCYVLDCLWNMSNPSSKLPDGPGCHGYVDLNYEPFLRKLRAAHPDTPIVMAEQCDVTLGGRGPKDRFVRALYEKLIAEGWKNLVYLPKDRMYSGDGDGTVDGCHPNDKGMEELAAAFGEAVKDAFQRSGVLRKQASERSPRVKQNHKGCMK